MLVAEFSLNINIPDGTFYEIGGPYNPKEFKDSGLPRSERVYFEGYRRNVNNAESGIQSALNTLSGMGKLDDLSLYSGKDVKLTVDYEKGSVSTWKFLGMDISDNFDAVIRLGGGYVIVGNLFDPAFGIANMTLNFGYSMSESKFNSVKLLVSNLKEQNVRKLATAFKTGAFYDIFSTKNHLEMSAKSVYRKVSDILLEGVDTSENAYNFSSIILNLIDFKEKNKSAVAKASSGSDDASVSGYVVSLILDSWVRLSNAYNAYYTIFSSLDLWSGFCKKRITPYEFNSRMSGCVNLVSNADGSVDDSMVSFSGVALNDSISDANIVRKLASDNLSSVSRLFGDPDNINIYSFNSIDFSSLLYSNVADGDVSDLYSLTEEEAQALSVLDSLRYIDEDARFCKSTYNMDDPEERGLFVKSAIRSYERNFKEFKPAYNYDVNDAMADLVEAGDIESSPVIPRDVALSSDDTNNNFTSDTANILKVKVDVSGITKALKLVNKVTSKIIEGF